MISQLMRYGGISAKVRAMQGNLLTSLDYDKLLRQKSVSDIAAYMKTLPSWSQALRSLHPNEVHRADLERALRNGINNEYERIFKFMPKKDRPIMSYLVRRRELDEIFRFMRTMVSGNQSGYRCVVPNFFKKHSKIDFECLERCRSFDDLLDCVRDSVYFDALASLPREHGEPPDYTIAKAALTSRYYSWIMEQIEKDYSGEVADALKEGFGIRVDLLNIETVLRIKRFFPQMTERFADYLVPYRQHLRKDFFDKLIAAPSRDEEIELLKNVYYYRLFADNGFSVSEDLSLQIRYKAYKKILYAPIPSVYTPIAYLGLKEIEVRNIINIIECVRYGETPQSANLAIIGM